MEPRSTLSLAVSRFRSKGLLSVLSAISRHYFFGIGTDWLTEAARHYFSLSKSTSFSVVQIETHSACNYSCTFCPNGKEDFPQGRMPTELFEKIIAQLSEFKGSIHLYLRNEPLLDVRLPRFVDFVKQNTRARIVIQTNGSLLNIETARSLCRNATVIVNDYTPNQEVVKRIQSWKVSIKGLISVDRRKVKYLSNRAGNLRDMPTVHLQSFCVRPFEQLYIAFNGDAVICCQDWKLSHVLGKTTDQTLEEIWNGAAYTDLREKLQHRVRENLCAKCDFNGI